MSPFTHYLRCEHLAPFLEAVRHQEPQLLLAFGDSNTCNAQYSAGAKQWGELLHSELRDQCSSQSLLFLNSGISGDCTVRGLRRWHSDVARFAPDCAIFAMGTNDRRLAAAEFRAAVERCLDRFAALGTRVLIRTPVPIMENEPKPAHLWRDDGALGERVAILRAIAEERALPLCDVYAHWHALEAAGTLSIGALMRDPVHTNGAGHQQVCRSVLPAFGCTPTFSWERAEASAASPGA